MRAHNKANTRMRHVHEDLAVGISPSIIVDKTQAMQNLNIKIPLEELYNPEFRPEAGEFRLTKNRHLGNSNVPFRLSRAYSLTCFLTNGR
jgi:hypothetical protein